MKVSIYGGANNKSYSTREAKECAKLGKYLGSIKAELLSGGCKGYPYYVGKAAIENGSELVVGYSPAMNEKEHVEKYGYPLDGVTKMIYRANSSKTSAQNLLQRMQDMVPFADVAVAIGGSWGTYYEITLAFWYKHTIILVEEFGGAVQAFLDTYKFMGERDVNPNVHFGPTIVPVKNIDGAIKYLEKYRKEHNIQ